MGTNYRLLLILRTSFTRDSQRNHVGCLLLSYSVVKEPTSAKGAQSARPSGPCQAEHLPIPEEVPSDSDCCFSAVARLERTARCCRLPGPRILGPVARYVNVAWNILNLFALLRIPACRLSLRQRSSPCRDLVQPGDPVHYSAIYAQVAVQTQLIRF